MSEVMVWPEHIQRDPTRRPATSRDVWRDYLEGRCNSRGEYYGEQRQPPKVSEIMGVIAVAQGEPECGNTCDCKEFGEKCHLPEYREQK